MTRVARILDGVLAGFCLLGALTVSYLLVADVAAHPSSRVSVPRSVGRVAFASGGVRRRPSRTLVWDVVHAGDPVADGDAVFVPPQADAIIALDDGSRLELRENSLVVVERPDREAKLAVDLSRGALSGESGGDGFAVRVAGATARFGQGSAAQVEARQGQPARVDVFAGEVAVASGVDRRTLAPREAALIDPLGLASTRGYPVVLVEPGREEEPAADTTVLLGAATTFRWSAVPGAVRYRMELSPSQRFTPVVATCDVVQTSCALAANVPRPFVWRVVALASGGESTVTEVRGLRVVLPPPELLVPEDQAEVVTQRLGVDLSWRAQPQAVRYALQVSTSPAFERVQLSWAGSGATAKGLPLARGRSYWRVRAIDQAGVSSAPSVVRVVTLVDPPRPAEEPSLVPPVASPPAPSFAVGVLAALHSNLGPLTVPRIEAELGYRPRAQPARIEWFLRAGYYTALRTIAAADAALTVQARLHAIPVELLGAGIHPTGPVDFVLGGGLSVNTSFVSLSTRTQPTYGRTVFNLGCLAILGVERPLGPGKAFAQLSGTLATRSRGFVVTGPSGLMAAIGYRMWVW